MRVLLSFVLSAIMLFLISKPVLAAENDRIEIQWLSDDIERVVAIFDEKMILEDSEHEYIVTDMAENKLFSIDATYAPTYSDGMIYYKSDDMYIFMDESGNRLFEVSGYDEIGEFHEGIAMTHCNGIKGFIDKTGKEIVPCKYVYALDFSEGLAFVGETNINGKLQGAGYINTDGEMVISYSEVGECKSFSEGLAATPDGYINKNGEVVIAGRGYSFSEGLALFNSSEKKGFINKEGEIVIPYDEFFETATEGFSCGLAKIVAEKNGEKTIKYINKDGNVAFSVPYDIAENFCQGLAFVENLDETSGFINMEGKEVIDCKYHFCKLLGDGRYGYVDIWDIENNKSKVGIFKNPYYTEESLKNDKATPEVSETVVQNNAQNVIHSSEKSAGGLSVVVVSVILVVIIGAGAGMFFFKRKKPQTKWIIPVILILSVLAVCVTFLIILLRKNTKISVGDTITFGSYEQDNNMDNGTELIKWYVMEMTGDEAVLLAVDVLDALPYEGLESGITWENSPLRSWLNGEFYSIAFNDEEKKKIVESHLKNEENPYYHTSGGGDTTDKVFLLSLADVEKYFDVSVDDWSHYIQNSSDNSGKNNNEYRKKCYEGNHRIFAYPSKYASQSKECNILSHEINSEIKQMWDYADLSYAENGAWWWLRSPGDDKNYGATVDNWGHVVFSGGNIVTGLGGVRPAIRVKL